MKTSEKRLISVLGQSRYKMIRLILLYQSKGSPPKNDQIMTQGHRSQLKGAPTNQFRTAWALKQLRTVK